MSSLVLGEQHRELARCPDGVHVQVPWIPVADVLEREDEPAAYDDVDPRLPSRSERSPLRVDAQLACDGAVDHEQRTIGAGGHQEAPGILRVHRRERLGPRDHHRQMLGFAPGHDGVDRDLAHGGVAGAGRKQAYDVVRIQRRALEHRLDPLRGGWDHWEAVGPSRCRGSRR